MAFVLFPQNCMKVMYIGLLGNTGTIFYISFYMIIFLPSLFTHYQNMTRLAIHDFNYMQVQVISYKIVSAASSSAVQKCFSLCI